MPICPKCGKSFSSEQALCYHLNKKYKCGTWKCAKCDTIFNTKFELKIHNMSCEEYSIKSTPSYDILCKIYANPNHVYFEVDNNDIIHSASPAVMSLYGYSPHELVGRKSTEFMNVLGDNIYRKTKSGELVQVEQDSIDKNIISERLC